MSTASAATATLPPVSSPILCRDFPGWLPPMLVKELRQGLRTRGFVGAMVLFQLFMLLLTLAALSNGGGQGARPGYSATSGFFWTIVGVQLLLVTPGRALAGLQQEVEARTLDLLMLTRLDAWRIVLGKWISLVVQAALVLVAMLPYLVVRYFTDRADILTELGRCLVLLGFSTVLTAAALWASGVAKVLRIALVILVVFWSLGMGGSFGPRFFGFRVTSSATSSPLFQLLDSPFDVINAALITAFFLVSAVRNIAPPAENHCFFARILPLVALLPAPFALFFGAQAVAARQLAFSGAFLALVLLCELINPRGPMPSHWREWRRRGPLTLFAGRAALPGWQSAYLFGLVAVAAWAAVALIVLPTGMVAQENAFRVMRLALLAFAALVFPAVLQSFLRPTLASPVLVYLAALVLPPLLLGLGWALTQSRWHITFFYDFMAMMPVSSFFFAVSGAPASPPSAVGTQGALVQLALLVAIAVLGAAYWRSRPYWQQLRLFEARDRMAAGGPA